MIHFILSVAVIVIAVIVLCMLRVASDADDKADEMFRIRRVK
jgi:hypothetical protein